MKKAYIIGAGGAAKEIYLLIKEINELKPTFDFKGFVDLSLNLFLQIGKTKFDIINEYILMTSIVPSSGHDYTRSASIRLILFLREYLSDASISIKFIFSFSLASPNQPFW